MSSFATAAQCTTDVLGTSRTLVLKREAAAYGTAQYPPLPLEPGEVVITFDDGPRPESTPAVLDALRRQCVQATFFMPGEALSRHRELARLVHAEGHSVGMHGFTHEHFSSLPKQAQLDDLRAMRSAYEKTFATSAAAYRFPFLEETPELRSALATQGITVVSMDVGADDWLPQQSPRMLTDRLLQRLESRGGGIVLLHDAQDQTAHALPTLLAALKTHGYRIVHLTWEPAQ